MARNLVASVGRVASRGFTLIELLLVIAILGILCAIVIPNLLNAVQRGKQTRTISDLRAIGNAAAAYQTDHDAFPIQDGGGPIQPLVGILSPIYVKVLPVHDGWAHDFTYQTDATGIEYTAISLGRDGIVSGPPSGPTTNFNDDIILSGGTFVTWPDGVQN